MSRIITFSLLLAVLYVPFHYMLKLQKAKHEEVPLGCKLSFPKYDSARQCTLEPVVSNSRVIAIGDIHGSYVGLLEDLYYANITQERHECNWKEQTIKTLLVQMGDMVDRGPGALESLKCLRKLQNEASKYNGEVVRLFGNHELWWLNGVFYEKHPVADTKSNVKSFISMLVEDIASGAVKGAHLETINNVPVVFVHAGFGPDYLKHLKRQEISSPERIVNDTASHLVRAVGACASFPCRSINSHEVFDAGPDRGGRGIGGPFWTDFGTIEQAVLDGDGPRNFIQIVGHTMAFCYSKRYPNVHPPDHQAECNLGLVRGTQDLSGVCVDGGMYLGARAFLEIAPNGHMYSYERRGNEGEMDWKIRDFTEEKCQAYKHSHNYQSQVCSEM